LPGGDLLAAAVAQGIVPSPEMVAAAGPKGALHPAQAWTLLGVILVGMLALATQTSVMTVTPSDVPKPPEVLAERARTILAGLGSDRVADSAFWFAIDPLLLDPPASRQTSTARGGAANAPPLRSSIARARSVWFRGIFFGS
jgi:serine/threonine-protein kinase